MPRPSNREKILTEGMRVLHRLGYVGASVRDISEAAEVPLGSFTNHFDSKEAFALEALEFYFAASLRMIQGTLLNEELSPLKRIRAYLDGVGVALNRNDEWYGCMLANFSIEASEHSEKIRKRVQAMDRELEGAMTSCLKAAIKTGDLSKGTDCPGLAGFITFSLHGAYLQTRVDRSPVPVERFKKFLFSNVLR